MDDTSSTGTSGGRRRILTGLAALGVVALVIVAFTSGFVSEWSDQARLERAVEDAGVWAPLLFLGLMIVLVPLNVPGLIFVIPATTLFGTPAGIALSLVGGFVASAVGVVAARRLGREVFQARMPEKVLHLEARVSRRGFWGVVGLRSITFLAQPVDWMCGLSRMPMRTVLGGTFVGLIPPTLVIALTGGGVLDVVL